MKQVIEKYFCDYCNDKMSSWEYEQGAKITIRVDLPHPEGKCGQVGATEMVLCKKCSEDLGIVNSAEYHDYTYSDSRLRIRIKEIKAKIVDMVFKK